MYTDVNNYCDIEALQIAENLVIMRFIRHNDGYVYTGMWFKATLERYNTLVESNTPKNIDFRVVVQVEQVKRSSVTESAENIPTDESDDNITTTIEAEPQHKLFAVKEVLFSFNPDGTLSYTNESKRIMADWEIWQKGYMTNGMSHEATNSRQWGYSTCETIPATKRTLFYQIVIREI